MLEELLKTRKQFVRWLTSQSRDTIVGVTMSKYHCPIANFIRETQEVGVGTIILVNSTNVVYNVGSAEVEFFYFPDRGWVKQFIRGIDKKSGHSITVGECLKKV